MNLIRSNAIRTYPTRGYGERYRPKLKTVTCTIFFSRWKFQMGTSRHLRLKLETMVTVEELPPCTMAMVCHQGRELL